MQRYHGALNYRDFLRGCVSPCGSFVMAGSEDRCVYVWNAETGELLRSQTFQNRWERLGKFDLPTELTMTEAGPSGLSVRSVTVSGHKLATPTDAGSE